MNTLKEAVETLLVDCRQYLEDAGPCDHSVGICVCDLIRHIEEAQNLISAVPATPQSAERGADNSQPGTSSPIPFGSEPAEHFRAPAGMEAEFCHLCGQRLAPGEIIVDAQIRGEAAYAHERCVDERDEDMREEGGAL